MATASLRQLEKVLTDRLRLKDPEFYLERLGGKLSGSVVSDSFRRLTDLERWRKIWAALDEEFGDESREIVGILLAYTKAEWHVPLQGDPVVTTKKRKTK